jgi:hypothetical protein
MGAQTPAEQGQTGGDVPPENAKDPAQLVDDGGEVVRRDDVPRVSVNRQEAPTGWP